MDFVEQKCFQGVSAIATTSDSLRIISGGVEGNVSLSPIIYLEIIILQRQYIL